VGLFFPFFFSNLSHAVAGVTNDFFLSAIVGECVKCELFPFFFLDRDTEIHTVWLILVS